MVASVPSPAGRNLPSRNSSNLQCFPRDSEGADALGGAHSSGLIESKLTSVFDFYGIFRQFFLGAFRRLFDLGWKWNDKMYHLQMILGSCKDNFRLGVRNDLTNI